MGLPVAESTTAALIDGACRFTTDLVRSYVVRNIAAVGASRIVVGQKPVKKPLHPCACFIDRAVSSNDIRENSDDSMRVLTTVAGIRAKPTLVRAKAPAAACPYDVFGRTARR